MTKKNLNLPKVQFHKTEEKGVLYIESASHNPDGKIERTYYIRYRTPDRRGHFEKVGRQFDKIKMTPAKARDIRADRSRGKELPNVARRDAIKKAKEAEAGKWTLSRLFDEYREQNPGTDHSIVKSRFKHVAPVFGDKTLDEIDPLSVDRLRVTLLKKLAPATTVGSLEVIRRLSNFAAKKRLCAPLPFAITMPKLDNQKTEDLSPEQLKRLLTVLNDGIMIDKDGRKTILDPDARQIMLVPLFTGMRRGEIFKLKWEDVDFRQGFITLVKPKGGKTVPIPLPPEVRDLFERRTRLKDCPYIFPGRGGRLKKDASKHFRAIRAAAELPVQKDGKPFRPVHGLRHVFGSMLASSGEVDMYTLQTLLTHKSPMMTQRYAHLRDETLKAASSVAGRIIGAATKSDAKKIKA
jgi:integrase